MTTPGIAKGDKAEGNNSTMNGTSDLGADAGHPISQKGVAELKMNDESHLPSMSSAKHNGAVKVVDASGNDASPQYGLGNQVGAASGPSTNVSASSKSASKPKGPPKARKPNYNLIHSLPAPIRTFPLPAIVPHNPLSILQLIFTWVSQTWSPPHSFPEVLYTGWFVKDSRSIHVTNASSQKALWSQGFYGKGSLSRSEMSWLEREKKLRGVQAGQTSEEWTKQRRAERTRVKWERARVQREAIDQKLQEERALEAKADAIPAIISEPDIEAEPSPLSNSDAKLPIVNSQPSSVVRRLAPVGPQQLLALPNSAADAESLSSKVAGVLALQYVVMGQAPTGPMELLMLPNSAIQLEATIVAVSQNEGSKQGNLLPIKSALEVCQNDRFSEPTTPILNGFIKEETNPDSLSSPPSPPKSVRFSPKPEQKTFLVTDPPSPQLARKLNNLVVPEQLPIPQEPALEANAVARQEIEIGEQEHFQLTLEEALFLSYGLGVLAVFDPESKAVINNRDLLDLCRQASYAPGSGIGHGLPDDPFMLSYVAYHHFRSLGWVVRGGIKFAVDLLLYNRGPPFSHAEFAVMILPSYSHAYWSEDATRREYVTKKEARRWSWLHAINRVNSQVKKTVILLYVDIPPPQSKERDAEVRMDEIFGRYKVREIVLKRWSGNRERNDKVRKGQK